MVMWAQFSVLYITAVFLLVIAAQFCLDAAHIKALPCARRASISTGSIVGIGASQGVISAAIIANYWLSIIDWPISVNPNVAPVDDRLPKYRRP